MAHTPGNLLPAYRRIEQELKHFIAKNHLKPHDKLPTEAQLAAEHNASVGTVRKAVDQLEAAQILYRRHGQGMFVAPRARRNKILVVPDMNLAGRGSDGDVFTFFMGALTEVTRADLPYEPILVEPSEFFDAVEDFKLVYPDASGVIFFRGAERCSAAEKKLTQLNIATLYYGTPWDENYFRYSSLFFQNEPEITETMARYLAGRGYRRVAGFSDDFPVCAERSRRFAEAAARHGLEYRAYAGSSTADPERLAKLAGEFDVLTTFVDLTTLEAMQILHYRYGIRTPEDVAMIGIDNLASCRHVFPGLTSVDLCNFENGKETIRRFAEQLESATRAPFRTYGQIRLEARRSC